MEELDLKDIFTVIRKRIWWIISIVIIACLAAGLISFFVLQPVYVASTKLIVNQAEDSLQYQSPNINDINTNIKLIDTYKEIMLTPAIMDRVVEAHPELSLSATQLANKVQVSSVNGTQVMTVRVQDFSYNRAADIVNAVSVTFQEQIPRILNIDNVTILNEAKHSDFARPVRPNPVLNIAIAFVVSLMAGVGLVFMLEYMDDTIKTEQQVEQLLGLPTLGVIASVKQETGRKRAATEIGPDMGGKSYAKQNI